MPVPVLAGAAGRRTARTAAPPGHVEQRRCPALRGRTSGRDRQGRRRDAAAAAARGIHGRARTGRGAAHNRRWRREAFRAGFWQRPSRPGRGGCPCPQAAPTLRIGAAASGVDPAAGGAGPRSGLALAAPHPSGHRPPLPPSGDRRAPPSQRLSCASPWGMPRGQDQQRSRLSPTQAVATARRSPSATREHPARECAHHARHAPL